MTRERLIDIDRARGLAMLLVVAGHLVSDAIPAGNSWYLHFNLIIYKFHMTFFMFLTGFVMIYTYPEIHTFHDYAAYVKKKFVRLMPAYLLFALLMAGGKTLLGQFVPVENPLGGLGSAINLIWRPMDSYCRNLWFIYVIFVYYLTIPPLLLLTRHRLEPLLVLALAVYFLPRYPYFGQKQVCQYLFVFLLGGYALRRREAYLRWIDKYSPVFFAAFIGCIVLYFVAPVPKLLFGVVAIPALHALVRFPVSQRIRLLAWVGQYAFPIYLLNSLVIGGLFSVLQASWSLEGRHFLVAAPVLFASGLLMPVVLYELFIRRVPILRSVVRV
jgi:fucose 4-O-acetylase-like acetyltransferase